MAALPRAARGPRCGASGQTRQRAPVRQFSLASGLVDSGDRCAVQAELTPALGDSRKARARSRQ